MLYDGIKLTEGSELQNLSVDIGASYPTMPSKGELFYKTGAGEGLTIYDGATWQLIADQRTITSVFPYTPVNQAGGSMTGLLVLSGAPTVANGAATKYYVDTGDAATLASAKSYTDAQLSTINISTASNIAGGVSGSILYQSAPSTTATLPIGSTGQVLTVVGGVPAWTTASASVTISNDTTTNGTFYPTLAAATTGSLSSIKTSSTKLSFNPATGTLTANTFAGALSGTATTATTATKATNIAGGALNQIPYQTAADTTAFIAAPTTAGTFLEWDGTRISWADAAAPTLDSVLNVGNTSALSITLTGSAVLTTPAATIGTLTLGAYSALSAINTNYQSGAARFSVQGTSQLTYGSTTVVSGQSNGQWSYDIATNGSNLYETSIITPTVRVADAGIYGLAIELDSSGTTQSNGPFSPGTSSSMLLHMFDRNLYIKNASGTLMSISSTGNVSVTGTLTASTISGSVSSSTITTGLGYTPANKAGDTFTGPVILAADPTVALGAATKQYVDAVASSLSVHTAVEVVAASPLTATYTAGTADADGGLGVGAKLTASAVGVLTIDGYSSFQVGSRVLVNGQTDNKQNGVYTVTTLGTASVAWVLTRATDANNHISGSLAAGYFVFVTEGTTYGGTGWVETAIGSGAAEKFKIGTDPITFSQFSGAGSYAAGTGIALTGNIISNTGVTSVAGTANQVTVSGSTGAVTISLPSAVTISGAMTAGSFVGAGTGLTGTATSLSIGGSAASATQATNIAGGLAGSIAYQTAANTTSFLSAGTSSQVLVSGATPSWTSSPALVGTNFTAIPNSALTNSSVTIGSTSISLGASATTIAGLTSVTSTTFVGALTGTASLATSVAGGTTGAVLYQSAANTTAALPIGTTGQVLTVSAGGLPTWAAATGSGGGVATNTANTFTAAQRGAVVALTASSSITPDFSLANNFSLTATSNFTLNFPTNVVAGQSGIIAITQDATGSRVVTFASGWVAAGGVKPVLSTAANSVDYISYYVETTARIFVSATLAVA